MAQAGPTGAVGRLKSSFEDAMLARKDSTASTNSSAYSAYSNAFNSSRLDASIRNSPVTPGVSSAYIQHRKTSGHKRGISEAIEIYQAPSQMDEGSIENSPDYVYRSMRHSLRPLPQPPNTSSSPTSSRYRSPQHVRNNTVDHITPLESENLTPGSKSPLSSIEPEANSPRPHLHHSHAAPHNSTFLAPDLQELKKSSTSHLKALSKFAQTSDNDEFSLSTPAPSVVGLHNRRQLKRTDSPRQGARQRNYGFGERNWMDKQRQFLQAYEYLCHIGEAKEWIEDIIHQSIPPIVELEEALRNGVTLAEIVQAFHPDQRLRIFRNTKLQFKHSDNIVLFFRFLEDVGLPELFRFELIDLYEKKNIPKVIYCIHALSWLLYRKGMVDFRIGNLVGQLQFQDHELEQTQRGLDKAGISMPSFHGMGASFGAEPEPEPIETEEERIDRELHENEAVIADLQTQMRGALVRMRLGDLMSVMWDHEHKIVELQAMIRGDWTRQVSNYRLDMQRFATSLQAATRGFLRRQKDVARHQFWQSKQDDVLKIQSLYRANRARKQVHRLKTMVSHHDQGVRNIQSAMRGLLARKTAARQVQAVQRSERKVESLQSGIRGLLIRRQIAHQHQQLSLLEPQVTRLQAAIRAMSQRDHIALHLERLHSMSSIWTALQSVVRARQVRMSIKATKKQLLSHSHQFVRLQTHIRAGFARDAHHALLSALTAEAASIVSLQHHVRAFLARQRLADLHAQLQLQQPSIKKLQAVVRGLLCRHRIGQDLSDLHLQEDSITYIQAAIRATLCRGRVGDLLSDLEEQEDPVVLLQAVIRGRRIRARFAEKKRFYKENMEKVVKIQSVVRAKIQGQAYKNLTSGKNPPVGTLKGFVHLLNDSDFDFEEEIEFERLRKTVVQHVRQNELADQYIQQLDIKIALLVKNKITLDEVVKHQRHFGGHVGLLLPNSDISSKDPSDLKALNKASRRKLEHYQELFFLLQTQPQYLSRLFRRIREQATSEKDCERIKHLVLGLFGYSQKRREEYYLLKLIVRSMREEIDYISDLEEYLRMSAFCNRVFSAYTKSPRDRKFHRDLLSGLVKKNFIDNKSLDLEGDPLQIYLSAISNEELRTGQRSRRDPNIPRQQAIKDPETRQTFISHMQDLRDITDQFFLSLEDFLNRIPFGVRYAVQQMHDALCIRFPQEDPSFVLQTVGQWLWRMYLQPALLEPEKSGVADRAMTQEQKKNLAVVAKVLNQASLGREFGSDNDYLQPLNNYIRESSNRLLTMWQHVVNIASAEEHYDIDEFNDLYAKQKPTLYIKMADIFSIHQLVSSEIASICPNPDDVLRESLRELGSVKSNESDLMNVSSGEIMLTLTPKYLDSQDPDSDIKALFTETKRCVLYIIRIQAGTSLLDILVKPVTLEDEQKWEDLVRDELSATSTKRGAYAELSNTLDFTTLSYPDLKRIALENVLQLEAIGRLSRSNQFQDLLNEIAVDIRTKHRRRLQRQRELDNVKTTLQRLNEQAVYLEQQLKTYNDYIEQAMVTLQNKKGKKRFLLPFTKQWDHERELQRSGRSFKFGSFKYSARTLADKGVLVHWRGYTEQQWFRVDITVSSNEVGVFTIEGSSGNMMLPGATAQVPLDDLLGAQFENKQFLEFFEGRSLRVNVNLFLHLIMRKFYNE
ncbi:iqgap- protein [Lithohypha guttulata]|uniref:Iqgap- protein n=1 Tax=Lithohypha guttulata TaxID=1690604 RepID=A0AAN7T7C2_9EURO|nr:iqgap- protein [Lithohypha guttulata]